MLQQGSHSSMTLMRSSSLLRLKPSAQGPIQVHRCIYVDRKSGSDAVNGVQVVGTGQTPLLFQPYGGQPSVAPSPLAQQMPLQLPALPSTLQHDQQPLQLRLQPSEQPSATAGAEQWPQHAQQILQQHSQQPSLEPLDTPLTESPDAPPKQCQELPTQSNIHACVCATTGDQCTGISAEGQPSCAAADEAMVDQQSMSDLLHCKQAGSLDVAVAAAAADTVPGTSTDSSTDSLPESRGERWHQQEADQHGQHGQHEQYAGYTHGQHSQHGQHEQHAGYTLGQHGQCGQHAGCTHGQQHEQHAGHTHGQQEEHGQHGQHDGQHERHASVIPSKGADEAELLPVGITTYTEVCPVTKCFTVHSLQISAYFFVGWDGPGLLVSWWSVVSFAQ